MEEALLQSASDCLLGNTMVADLKEARGDACFSDLLGDGSPRCKATRELRTYVDQWD